MEDVDLGISEAEIIAAIDELDGMNPRERALKFLNLKQDNLELTRHAFYDTALTGLLNKAGLIDKLNAIELSLDKTPQHEEEKRRGNEVSYTVFDGRDLHWINNTYGQDAGDQFLLDIAVAASAIARRENDLATSIRLPTGQQESGVAARGGSASDEFVVVNTGIDREGVDGQVKELEKILNQKEAEAQKKYPGIKYGLSIAKAIKRPDESVTQGFIRTMASLHEAKEAKKLSEEKGQTTGDIPAGGIWVD